MVFVVAVSDVDACYGDSRKLHLCKSHSFDHHQVRSLQGPTKASPHHVDPAMGQGYRAKRQETVKMVDTAGLQPVVTKMHQADAATGQASAGGAAPGQASAGGAALLMSKFPAPRCQTWPSARAQQAGLPGQASVSGQAWLPRRCRCWSPKTLLAKAAARMQPFWNL